MLRVQPNEKKTIIMFANQFYCFFSIIITILIIFIIIIRLKERGNLGLEHRDGRKNKSIGDQPSSREDRGNPTPTPHGVMTDDLSPEKQ